MRVTGTFEIDLFIRTEKSGNLTFKGLSRCPLDKKGPDCKIKKPYTFL